MIELLVMALLILGGAMMLLAAAGLVRMPDLFMRMQATSKAATMGVGSMFLAVALHYRTLDVLTRVLLTIGFFFLTAPIAAHMLARAAYFVGVPLWEGTVVDELHHGDRPLEAEREETREVEEEPEDEP